MLRLANYWLCGIKSTTAVTLSGLTKNTIASYYKMFRDLVAVSMDVEEGQIGGKEIVVEIDEMKMEKRKYNRGHRVDGVWVVGGVERTPERRIFFVAVENKNAETMREV
jgi:hypothetical protein